MYEHSQTGTRIFWVQFLISSRALQVPKMGGLRRGNFLFDSVQPKGGVKKELVGGEMSLD